MSKTWKTMCSICRVRPLAMPRVEYCFTCWPGGPVIPPPCLRCGSRSLYYASGLCQNCHPSARPPVSSCTNCLAWGAGRHLKWHCKGCNSWCRKYSASGSCRICRHSSVLDVENVCRLCRKQAAMARGARALGTLEETNRYGQQLFIADLFSRHGAPQGRRPQPQPPAIVALPPATHRQLVLFEMARTLRHRGRRGLAQAADPGLAALTEQLIKERAARYGWSHGTLCDVRAGVNIMLGFQDTPGVAITATDVAVLAEVELPIRHVLAILGEAGMLEDDRVPALITWFKRQVHDLPTPMTEELQSWFQIMNEGSTTTPRQHPRTATTIRLYLGWALPTIRDWAAQGKNSLREISSEDVRAALPTEGPHRSQTGRGLRSIFRILKARGVLFMNPINMIKTGYEPAGIPTPLNVADIKEALDSPDPARALVTAFHAFHALGSLQMQQLKLTDIRDGRLILRDRSVPLAEPVKKRLTAYLDHRHRRWPNTANPYLFVHFRTANNTGHVGYRWIYLLLGPKLNTRSLRSDRFLHEALATGGDTRRLTDLFGLSFQAAQRYTDTLDNTELGSIQTPATDHPDLSS